MTALPAPLSPPVKPLANQRFSTQPQSTAIMDITPRVVTNKTFRKENPMKAAFLICGFLSTSLLESFADGYPFDPETQHVTVDTLRVRLSKEQVEAVASTGIVPFTDLQLLLIRRFYPYAVARQSVISATFNDNNEGLSAEDVYVFWVAAEEVAITLNPKVLNDEHLLEEALVEVGQASGADVRVGPDGTLYSRGKRVSRKELLEFLETLAGSPATGGSNNPSLCISPPFHLSPWTSRPTFHASDRTIEEHEKSLSDTVIWVESEAKKLNLSISRTW